MPVYLVHGFRWPREGFTGIRVHAIVNNLDDCSVDYIQNEHSRADLLDSFRKAYPDIMQELEGPGRKLEFIEQYNPDDVDGPYALSQPFAYVGDKVVVFASQPGSNIPGGGLEAPTMAPTTAPATATTKTPSPKRTRAATQPMSISAPFNSPQDAMALSVNVEELIADGPGLTNKAWEALADLRDKVAEGEKIGWWVVYNGDPDRAYDEEDEEEDTDEYTEDVEGEEDNTVQPSRQYQQQQRPLTSGSSVARPRTAPSDARNTQHPPPPAPLPHIATQQQGLTALPIRPNPAGPATAATQSDKGKQKDNTPEPALAKAKDTPKSQSFRRKLFGRRS